jgi:hypothetical protein
MKTIVKIMALVALLFCSVYTIDAQEAASSAYFLDGYSFRHELNPAFEGEYNYISIPALGNINAGVKSNLGLDDILYKTPEGYPYKLTTFMSPTVDASTFLNNIPDNSRINLNADVTLLSAGFKAFHGFNTITIGLHTEAGVNLPKELLRFMKLGQTSEDTQYKIQNLDVNASSYAEIALGHSHKLSEKLTVGGKLKLLLGLANVNTNISDLDLRLSDDVWAVRANGEMRISAGSGLRVPTRQEIGNKTARPSEADIIEWDEIDYDHLGLTGMGLGIDLGVTYNPIPDLQLSFAVTDLGFINWRNGVIGETGDEEWDFDGFQDVAINSNQPDYEENKLSEQLDAIWDDLQDIVNFHRKSTNTSYTRMLNATFRLGAEYQLPFYKKLTAGALITRYQPMGGHTDGINAWTEGRLFLTVKPTKWFDATVNGAASTFGTSFGWMLNFHPRGFNFFIGTDHQIFKVTPQYVPVGKASATLNIGFNVTFGS